MEHISSILELLYHSQFRRQTLDLELESWSDKEVTRHLYSTGRWLSSGSNRQSIDGCQRMLPIDTEKHRLLYAGPYTWRIEYEHPLYTDAIVSGSNESGCWVRDHNGKILFTHRPTSKRDWQTIDESLSRTIFPIRALPGMRVKETAISERWVGQPISWNWSRNSQSGLYCPGLQNGISLR